MCATYTSEQVKKFPDDGLLWAGVSRLAQAAVEQSYDKDGLFGQLRLLPRHYYHPNVADAQQIEAAEHPTPS